MTVDPAYIRDLEHGTIRPVGEYPNHCGSCYHVAETRRRQAACDHPDDRVEQVEMRWFARRDPVILRNCGICGKTFKED
ncbi:MAG: hypothetical protein GEU78_09505 [Actinobacteria bacterium]|nr:hypothetical protein [Actinomycetota bacterium]